MKPPRIAVFQYEWPLQSYSKDLVEKLSENGYRVDFFSFNASKHNFIKISEKKNLRIHSCEKIPFILYHHSFFPFNIVLKVLNKIRWIRRKRFEKLFSNSETGIIDPDVLIPVYSFINKKKYKCFIGIEKKGLIWAGILSSHTKTDLLYYSLELYVDDHPQIPELEFAIREAEKKYHAISKATMIQDAFRAKILFQYNQISSAETILIPLSVRGLPYQNHNKYFQKKFGVQNKSLILYFGMINEGRFCTEYAKVARSLPNDMAMVLHGFGENEYLDFLRLEFANEKLILSTDFIDDSKLLELVSSAKIGLSLYHNEYSNDRLTAFSSQKIALYCQCGIPFVAFRNESYEKLTSAFKCAELIDTIDELLPAINRIDQNYTAYSESAFKAFNAYYNFDKNFEVLHEYLKS